MEYIVKKTTECSKSELLEMNNLFNEVFDKQRTLEEMLGQYTKNYFGYSYHSLFIEEGRIVGMNVYVPHYYKINGKKVVVANSIDSMIQKQHRDFFNFLDIVQTAYEYMQKEGVVLMYGYPNDTSYPILTKGKLAKEVGRMYTYCLPYRIGGIKKELFFLNWASMAVCWIWVYISTLISSSKVHKFIVEKDLNSFNDTRYLHNNGEYIKEDGFVYKIMNFDGYRTAFLIDVYEKSAKNYCRAVKKMLKDEGKNFDILLYPGYLPFGVNGMIKIPHRFEPKHFPLVCKLFNKNYQCNELWDIKNWDTNLSNYDLI